MQAQLLQADLGGMDVQKVLLIVSIVVGLLSCFYGYRLFKLIMAVCGFIVGAGLCYTLMTRNGQDPNTSAIVAVLAGMILAGIVVALYYVGVFFAGASLGAVVALGFVAKQGADPQVAVIAGALIGGVLAILLHKFILILGTSFGGAWGVVTGAASLAGYGPEEEALRAWHERLRDLAPTKDLEGSAQTFGETVAAYFQWYVEQYSQGALIAAGVLGVIGFIFQYSRKKKVPAPE